MSDCGIDWDRVRELMFDDPSIQRLVDEAPPTPEATLRLLRANDCPVLRRRKGTAA